MGPAHRTNKLQAHFLQQVRLPKTFATGAGNNLCAGRAQGLLLQERDIAQPGRFHVAGMESPADGKPHTTQALLLQRFARRVDILGLTTDHCLHWAVVVGDIDLMKLMFKQQLGQPIDVLANDRRHRPTLHRCHQLSAFGHQPQAGRQVKSPGAEQRGIQAQAVAD
ncbi:hypothetical protein D3C75_994130 [compost metagenome]